MVFMPFVNINFISLKWILVAQFDRLKCYQCDENYEDETCWKEDSDSNFGREIECEENQDACAKSIGGKNYN